MEVQRIRLGREVQETDAEGTWSQMHVCAKIEVEEWCKCQSISRGTIGV